MNNTKNIKNTGTSIGNILGKIVGGLGQSLTILFCVLRACGIIEWGWFYIMLPIFFAWGSMIISLIILGIILVIAMKTQNGKTE